MWPSSPRPLESIAGGGKEVFADGISKGSLYPFICARLQPEYDPPQKAAR